ncbi:MAG TPA: SPFH domain-containing protein [Caulobacteraceae bacterium]|nr:SPFH domain-containing protein [Caulobacteraceae bacterium]
MTAAPADKQINGAWAQSLSLSFRFLYLVVFLLGVGWAISNCRVIPPESRAVVTRFGQVVGEQGSGLLLALPRPIEEVLILPSATRQIEFKIQPFQSSARDPNGLNMDVAAISDDARQNTGMLLTGDFSVVHLDATLFYQINDARAYVLAGPHVTPALERLFIASAVTVCGSRDLDAILVARPELDQSPSIRISRDHLRADLMTEVNRRLRDLADQGNSLGISVTRVDLLPSIPADAKDAFDSVLRAVQEAETVTAQARTSAERVAQGADEDKDRMLTNAEASAEETVTKANARTADITALANDSHGLSGSTLANQIYRNRIGNIIAQAQDVVTIPPSARSTLVQVGR